MNSPATINIADAVDNSRVRGFQIGIFTLCAACLIMDGFDVQAIGYVAPEIIREMELTPAQMGALTSAGLIGILVGAFLFSILGDRLGRRPVLIAATFCFSALTLATGFASSLAELVTLRFVAGIGLGGIMPNLVALVGEYSPRRSRVFIMMLIQNGFNVGAMLGGFVALWLVPQFGWRSVFYFGGVVPLVLGAMMLLFLPESLQFLALKSKSTNRLVRWLKRVDPAIPATEASRFVVPEKPQGGVPVTQLFQEGRATGTALLWTINFMNLVVLYFLAQWLPTVFGNAGMSQSNRIWVGTTLQAGGVVGTLALGWLISKFGYTQTLTVSFGIGCVAVAFIGQPMALSLLFAVVFVAGFCIVGGQGGLNALAASFYPTELRSTGIGSALGVGRLGAIFGQPAAGFLVGRAWPPAALFLAAAAPAMVTASALFVLRRYVKPQGGQVVAAERATTFVH
jgi:AAHS family 4-hydroxybenzoate transporter-like MFS transporter